MDLTVSQIRNLNIISKLVIPFTTAGLYSVHVDHCHGFQPFSLISVSCVPNYHPVVLPELTSFKTFLFFPSPFCFPLPPGQSNLLSKYKILYDLALRTFITLSLLYFSSKLHLYSNFHHCPDKTTQMHLCTCYTRDSSCFPARDLAPLRPKSSKDFCDSSSCLPHKSRSLPKHHEIVPGSPEFLQRALGTGTEEEQLRDHLTN